MIYKTLFLLVFSQCAYCQSINSVTSLFQNFFSANKKNQVAEINYQLESICFSTSATSNQKMPTKIHLVIIYNTELAKDLMKRSAKQYFQMLDNLIDTHAQFLKIMSWTLPAQEYISPHIEITYNKKSAKPVCIMIFSDVGGKKSKLGRYVISERSKHVHIYVKQQKLQIDETEVSVLQALKTYKKKFGNKVQVYGKTVETYNYDNAYNNFNQPSTVCNMSMSASPQDQDEDYYNPLNQSMYLER